MDKGKGGAIKRGPNKVKGTKAARPTPDISDTKAPATLPAAAAAKKAKLTSRPSGKGEQWDSLALEGESPMVVVLGRLKVSVAVEAGEVVSKVLDAEDKGEDAKVEAYLCGAVKLLKQTKNKPDQTLYLSLLYLAKTRPNYFSTKSVTEVYLEDSLGDRVWVDQEDCRGFVDNIQTAFNTTRAKPLVAAVSIPENQSLMAGPSPPSFSMEEDETSSSSIPFDTKENVDNIAIQQRYLHNWEAVEAMVVEAIQDQLSRRQAMEVSRNTLRLLAATAGLSEVRLLVSQRLELWLHNPKLTKPAQDLLLVLCLNCNKHNQHDVEVISNLIKIRIKKPLLNHFLHCLKELLGRHPDNLSTVLKNAIYNELSNARGLYNLQVVALIFQHAPDQAPRVLAEVFRDLLLRKDDYLRVLRALLREIVRTLRHDLNFGAFCLGLLQERKDPVANTTFRELEQSLKERYFYAIADLVVLTIFLAISPSVREVAAAYSRGDKKDIGVLRTYQAMVAGMQRDAVWWLHTLVHKMMPKMSTGDFVHCLHKVLFMESAEHYFNKDGWPPENERGLMLRLASEVPVLEDTLVRILVMGYSRDHPISAPDALDLTDQLIRRAAAIFLDVDKAISKFNCDLQQEREQILEFESHLAGSAITETNSHLVTKLMGLDPRGRARRPPTVLLETLSPLSKSLRLGQRLCSSDFLLDVIQRQGTSQAMPWLADLVESSPSFSMLPVQCLCEFLLTQDPAPKDMAQMVVERSTIVNVIVPPDQPLQPRASYFLSALLNIFLRYLHAAKKPATKEAYAWADTQDHILVQWSNEEAATLHIVVVHAMVILLTFGPPLNDRALFDELLNTWFPPSGDVPQAYLVDTSEEALLLPDWLKLRMIRSSVDVLVDAGWRSAN
ncbi:INTS1 [Cordylochernes scorpioides]|uniref:INTS1 n=1 Tax=Cordylochernes scorpioides TaxID=51811 RepID=A0ABY6KRS8_9ARAC|nr:INTS1 [Cordylochernes scorpioides]